jgi:sugar-specific transcriptional regulator TrmB
MDAIHGQLRTLGMTDTEIEIYRAGLAYDTVGANELAKQTGIKRPTVYHALETLLQKGLVAKSGTAASLRFSMADPATLSHLIDQRIGVLQKQKDTLGTTIAALAQSARGKADFRVEHYEGIDGIKSVVEQALYCKTRKWDIIAPKKNFFSQSETAYAQYFMEARKRRGISARSLWETKLGGGTKASELAWRQPRLLPKVMHGTFTSVVILFDVKLAVISSHAAKSAVLITSKELRQTFGAMFEGLWSTSEPV